MIIIITSIIKNNENEINRIWGMMTEIVQWCHLSSAPYSGRSRGGPPQKISRPPLPLSQSLDDPTSLYLRVWIQHCPRRQPINNTDIFPLVPYVP